MSNPPGNFFDSFDDPATAVLANKPVRDAQRADAAETRAAEASRRADASEARAQAEFDAKYKPAPAPGDSTKTGDDYLATLPPDLAAQVKALSEGRRAFPTGAALRSPQMQELVAAAAQYDPTLDAANAATRVATRKDFTSGVSARNKTSINTAIGHLVSLARAARDLNNTDLQSYNSVANWLSNETGDPRVNNFNIKRDAVATELAKVFKGTGGAPALAEIHDWQSRIDAAQSPDQLREAVLSGVDLLNSRLDALNQQYVTGMGKSSDPMEMLTPHAREEYEALSSGAIWNEHNDTKRVGVFDKPPTGMELSGEGVKGYRFTPEQEASLHGDLSQPKFDINSFADHVTQFALQNGAIKPEQADAFRQHAIENAKPFVDYPLEQRRQASINYSDVDKSAAENAGIGETLLTAAKNLPTSAASYVKGLGSIPVDALASVIHGEREGTFKTTTDLAAELAGKLVGQQDSPTVDALSKALSDRYGSVAGVKQAFATDPAGVAGDVSMVLSGGGTAAARLGRATSMAGLEAAGTNVARLGAAIDPISGIRHAPELAQAAAARIPQGLRTAAVNVPSDLAGLPSGAGGATLREAASAGFERGRTGAPTPRSQAFTQGMRDPGGSVENIVTQARDAIANLRQAASQRYQAQMASFGRNPVPLNIDAVRQRLIRIRPRNYDAMLDAPSRPSTHVAWQAMMDNVDHYAQQAAADPSLLEPLQMDAFKQDLYEAGASVGGAYDRNAARIAREAYDGVRQLLVQHDPVYASTMADYERAAREAQQLETSFGLAAARGKSVNIDSASRRLQSIMRNNAYTNYGRRTAQGHRLNDLGTGELMAGLAGQTASSTTPRGLHGITGVGTGVGGVAMHNPAALAMLPAFSPRAMGEMSYGAGRAAGTAARGVDALAQGPVGRGAGQLLELQRRYPGAFNATAAASNNLQETEAERLAREYGITMPEARFGP